MTTKGGPRFSRRAFVTAAGAALTAAALPAYAAETSGALQIWFVRHAECEINVPGNPRALPDGGMTYPLTRKGVEQAKALAEATADVPIVAVYTSTNLPAVQTADAIAFRHDLTLSLAPEAVELDLGIKPGSQKDSRAVYVELARKWTVEKDLEARHGEGESFADVQRRFLPFVREVMNRHAQDSGVVVILAHAATLGFMVPVLASNVPSDYAVLHPLPNTGIVKTELRDSRLFCLDWLGIPAEEFGNKEP
jgi:alpha-ribazole phosphatase/probable phosphoglycerate mutase